MEYDLKTYTIREVAEILQCSEGTARDLIQRLPHCRVGHKGSTQGMIRISDEVLRGYINGNIALKKDERTNVFISKPKPKKAAILIPNTR